MTRPEPGVSLTVMDGVRCILAPNPGPMTYWGTNTWLLGEREIAVIDPGPLDASHLNALLAATAGQRVTHILVTHAHADHSPSAARLSEETDAPVYAFGPPEHGRRKIMGKLAQEANIAGGEGVDAGFRPDHMLGDGDIIQSSEWALTARHTPGHFAGHLSFQFEQVLFSGDHVMEWATTLVSPPDGDVGDFLRSSRRIIDLDPERCLPGHGVVIADPVQRLSELIAHRKNREAAILRALEPNGSSLWDITGRVYADTPPEMHAAAARNVLAHLVDLWERKRVRAEPHFSVDAYFRAI